MSELAIFGGAPVLGVADHASWPEITDDDRRAVMAVLDRGILSGAYAEEAVSLEKEFAAYVGAKHAVLTHSGTAALQLAVAAAGVAAGDEVIVPAYSFVATPLCVALEGAVPVFVDVDSVHGLMDPASVERAITPHTKAIMPVHVHGAPADLGALSALAKKHKLLLIEDAAQAHGATWKGKPVGALFDGGGFSLQSSKNLSAGEGGLYVTNDDGQAREANRVRNFGQDLGDADRAAYDSTKALDGHRGLESVRMGGMYRGNEMMAAFTRSQLRRLAEKTARMQENAARLTEALAALPGVLLAPALSDRTVVHHKFRVRFDLQKAGIDAARLTPRGFRDLLTIALKAEGAEAVLWQGGPLPAQTLFQRRMGYGAGHPFVTRPGGTDLAQNYDPAHYPATQKLLDTSVVLFSQTRPLIAQSKQTVDAYARAFTKVWAERHALVARGASGDLRAAPASA